ncbi:MAG: hypothetical protein PVI09_07370 [Anaerolineae bacterium]
MWAGNLADTLTETVEMILSPLTLDLRAQIQIHCCLTVGGEQAMELLNYPPARWGGRQIVILHEGREHRLDAYVLAGMTTTLPEGLEA